ncbi:MAG: N-acetylmuramoyl-L-alanine amidase domain-containing protein, partial [Parcubacteria group bacterium LiPW_39]
MKKSVQKLIGFFIIWLVLLPSLLSGDVRYREINVVLAQTQNEVSAQNLIYSNSDVPVILPRSIWDNTPSLNALMTWPPQNSTEPIDWQPVERIILHDTGCDTLNPTCNNNQNPVATIQGIYRYHAVTQGWGDIGYNYIIDQQGRIYEGRYGGNGSRGAHTYYDRAKDNFNFGSIGIAVLGNYAKAQPPPVVSDSLARLVGWLCAANNLEPQGKSASFIWNTIKGGFKSFYTGSVVAGHKDVEPGNPDPGLIDLAKIRQEAAVYADKFKDYIYQPDGGDSKIYQLQAGSRKIFANLAVYASQGLAYAKLIKIAATQLDIFSETRFLKYPDGSLLRVGGYPAVYLIEDGKKRSFEASSAQFKKLGFDFANVKEVTPDELNKYPLGGPIKYGPDNALLSDGQRVYLITNGKKRWFSSGKLFSLLGYKWPKVKLAAAELPNYLTGEIILYPDGTLLRVPSQPTVYLVRGGQKHEFLSAQSFLKNGHRWDKVILAEPAELALYPRGNFVPYPDGALIKAENSPSVFLIDKGKIRAILSEEIFRNLKYKLSPVLTVSPTELAYYTQGEPVKYSSGTLLRAKNGINVYLIVDGQPQLIDAATFKKKKYKWSQVLVISDQDFNNLYGPKPVTSAAVSTPTPLVPLGQAATTTSGVTLTQPQIRIAVFEVATSTALFSADGAFDVFDKNGQKITTKAAHEIYTYQITNPAETFARIVPQSAQSIVEVVSYKEHPAWKPTLNYNQFRGAVEIIYSAKSQKVWAVNELNLEDYLRGVAEASQTDPAEYQKTMAAAARTYAYYYLLKGGKHGSDEVFHLKNTAGDQLYKGYTREAFAPAVIEAVKTTQGEIATFNSQPIVAAYSSGAGELQNTGTRSACTVWGGHFCQTGFEYLAGGVKDPAGTEYNYATCSGPNHCVGLSGAGTRQFAKTGTKNYQEI